MNSSMITINGFYYYTSEMILLVARVLSRGDRPPSQVICRYLFRQIWGDKEFLSLIGKKKMKWESLPSFWLLSDKKKI